MKMMKRLSALVLLSLGTLGLLSARAETFDFTADWNIVGSYAVGKSTTVALPEETGEVYYTLSGLNSGSEYTFSASGSNTYVEVLYKYSVKDTYEDGSGKKVTEVYIDAGTIGCDDGEGEGLKVPQARCVIEKQNWEDDIFEDPSSETGAKVKPSGYYLHVSGNPGAAVAVTSAKGVVMPERSGLLTVRTKGAPTATWSLKGQSGAFTNGQTVAIMGQQTIVYSKSGSLTKPADKTVAPAKDGEEIEVTGVYGMKLTLKGATAEYAGEEHAGSLTVVPGDEVTLQATESETTLFQCWTPSKSYDFGSGYSAASSETTIVMPAAALTMTATSLKASEAAWMTMYATAAPVTIGDETVRPADGDLQWSTDGKTWYVCGKKTLVKKGSYTVQWKSASGSWVGPTSKAKVTLKAGQDYSNADCPAAFTFVTVLRAVPVVYKGGEWSESAAGGTVTMKPADGRINATATAVTLTAKANKGYAFLGWQFEKDLEESGLVPSGCATLKMTLTSDVLTGSGYLDAEDHQVHYLAVFRPIADYTEDSVRKAVPGVVVNGLAAEATYEEGGLEGEIEVQLGLNCSSAVTLIGAAEARPLTYRLAGTLPKGLKFDAAKGQLSGTPSASGTYPLELTAADPAGHVCTLAVTLVVKSVFEPVVGDWRAFLKDGDGAYAGLFEMSITEKGKASAKIVTATGTTSLAPTVTWTADVEDPDGEGLFTICYWKETGNERSGSWVSLSVDPGEECAVTFESMTWKNGETTSETVLVGTPVRAESKWLKDGDFAAAFLGKYYTVALSAEEGEGAEGYRTPQELAAPGYLTVTTDKKGAVKVAGKLADGEKVSASAVLLPATNGLSASAMLFVVPSGYKKKGSVALQLDISSEGAVSSSVGSWTTPPLLDAIAGVECEEEVFLPGLLSLSANGAVYSKLDDLTDYYMSLAVGTGGEMPALEYSYTDGEKAKRYDWAEPAVEGYELGSDMLKGGKGGKITVEKSPAPWKDSEGEWHYDETKEDKEGETKPITNPGSLTISFKPATGVFSGKFNLFFDYEVPQYKGDEETDPKKEHKSVSCSYEGVLVNGGTGVAAAQYAGKFTHEYETPAGKAATKTYTKKYALPVTWSLDE